MRARKLLICIVVLVVLVCCVCTGCSMSGGNEKTPQELIADAYGSSTFNISFNSEGLDEPIRDITYSAINMPQLPIPEKVGYIFSGWYMDKEFTIPYTDGILYLYMKDVVLYPKWTREEFVVNGVYEINYSAKIIEDTVKLGTKTEQYGGYKDFTECLIADDVCIEKTDGKKLLRLKYDSENTVPFTAASGVFDVSVSRQSASNVFIEDVIDAQTDTVKTIFLNIDSFDLTDTLYLDIVTTNYGLDVPSADYISTATRYTVAFDITKIIGFSSTYIDPDSTLEEGWYLAKTYYRSTANEPNMGSSYNPVYSYIYSDGKNYSLIKQNIPYDGLVSSMFGGLNEDYLSNYYNRGMTFVPIQLYYDINLSSYGSNRVDIENKYLPQVYDAGYYGEYSVEFHADEMKYYNIFDLGESIKKSFIVQSAVTGFMEVVMAMGYANQILTVDYDHVIKLTEVDYKPLTGDAYQYNSSMQYYAGSVSDINSRNMVYDAITEYGMTTDMINFFFSAGSLDAPLSSRNIYSSKITVTPTAATNALTVADSRYTIAHFDVNAQIYGYDAIKDRSLYADEMRVQTFGSEGIRETVSLKTGRSCKVGETIRLSDIYSEKVDNKFDFSNVSYKAYRIKNGTPDFSSEINLGAAFVFEEDVAVLFTSARDDGTKSTLVELVLYSEPKITITSSEEFPYDANASYSVGSNVAYPDVRYTWMGKSDRFIGRYYDAGLLDGGVSINVGNVALFSMDGAQYTTVQYGTAMSQKQFTIPSNLSALVYQLTNEYGERYFYTITFDSASQTYYFIRNDLGEEISSGKATYLDGERRPVTLNMSGIINKTNYSETLSRTFTIAVNDITEDYVLSEYSIYTDSSYAENISASENANENIAAMWNAVKDSDYAYLRLVYMHGQDKIISYYLYNITFGGMTSMDVMQFETYYTNHNYSLRVPILYGSDGTELSVAKLYVTSGKYKDKVDGRYQMDITFTDTGSCTISYEFYLYGKYFGGATTDYRITHSQTVDLISNLSDVTITYVTDADHPFSDGTFERTVTYSLAENIFTLTKSSFANSGDILYGWIADYSDDVAGAYAGGAGIADFISDFNSNNVTLYSVWDYGFTVTIDVDGAEMQLAPLYLGSNGTYSFNPSGYKIIAPSGYQYIGLTGGFIGNGIITSIKSIKYKEVRWDDPDYFKVSAVFAKIHAVSFSIDQTCADLMLNFKPGVQVVDGNKLPNPNAYNIICKDGYEFLGWYVEGDDSQAVVDFSTYVITKDTTFVALFKEVEND